METFNNKYKTWHDNIIARGKNRILTGYKEKHHILPRCLGGDNSKENLVALTPKEHFIIHMLLCKFTLGKSRIKMLNAFHAMIYFTKKNRNYKVTSRIVEKLKIEFQKNNPVFDPEVRRKIGIGNKGKTVSKESRLKMSTARMGNKNALGLIHSEEFKERIKNKHKGNKYCLGKRYLNKDGKNLVVNKSEVDKYLNQGYKLGMDKSYITKEYITKQSLASKGNTNLKGRICIYKEKTNKFIYKTDLQKYIKLGFKKGRNEYYMNDMIRKKISQKKKEYWDRRVA